MSTTQLPRMTTRRWMIAVAVGALICAGLVSGSPHAIAASIVCLAIGPMVLTIYVLARRLGLNTLFR